MAIDVTELRPVEALWLLSEENEGQWTWTRENALRSVLVSLSIRGLLEPEEDGYGFKPTRGDDDSTDLRPYEKDVLTAIEGRDDEQEMVSAVYNFDFRGFFVENGFYEVTEEEKSVLFGLLTWTETTYEKTQKCDRALDHLDSVRDRLSSAVNSKSVRSDEMPLIYSFPGTAFFNEFDSGETEELVVDPDSVDLPEGEDAAAATGAAAGASAAAAASSAASCAAASSATASAACAAGAGGAAAGGAAAGGA